MSRPKKHATPWLEFQPSHLQITNQYYAKYEAISRILDENTQILDLVHRDLKMAFKGEKLLASRRRKAFQYSAENLLRILLCQVIEGASLREIVVRIDDSHCLRRFTRMGTGPMMDFTTLDRLRNAIRPETWKRVNQRLAKYAIQQELATGDSLRIDTTAVETNVHFPTDSALLWDGYRTLARLIEKAREIDWKSVDDRRLQTRCVKRLHVRITRKRRHKDWKLKAQKRLYRDLLGHLEWILDWSGDVAASLRKGIRTGNCGVWQQVHAESLVEELDHYRPLVEHAIWQARERVLEGRPVKNRKKLFSLFEPHTELLIRGKAGKNIEFGHMIEIRQVEEKFITGYDVFSRKPHEPGLLAPAVREHERLFGTLPDTLAADKGYWAGSEEIRKLEERIPMVSIAKKGRRNEKEAAREVDPFFRHAQRFRAGVEGTISFLKRVLGLTRCLNRGWEHYSATVGLGIFAHNLLILARC